MALHNNPPIVTRFAPSPTGHLHVGGARTALFCWAFARRHGGHFLLRIEDTDRARSSDDSARGIMEDLAWLGIDWDEGPELNVSAHAEHDGVHDSHIAHAPHPERAVSRGGAKTLGGDPRGVGPFFQARRVGSHYDPHVLRLVEMGKAYPAFESNEEIDAERTKAIAAKQTYRYNRASYDKVPSIKERLSLIERGEPHVIRFVAPHSEILVRDRVLGDVKIAAGELDDFVLRKADGFPTYHFAVVVDDHAMGVTHVLRAQEHLANTPRHVALQQAFGFASPVYGHMPLIFNMDGTKMSKRDKAKAARKALKDALAKPGAPSIGGFADAWRVDQGALGAFLNAENDSLDIARVIAVQLRVPLPEIEVADFREAGYTPGAICNFLSLLGWNPGMKTPDGKDLEKFDNAFLAEHFALDRIGKGNAKFDRTKLLSFNADSIAALPDGVFADRWRSWCEEFSPALPAAISGDRFGTLAKAIKGRAKTMRDGVTASAFAMLDGGTIVFDKAAVEKALLANASAGLSLLREFREDLAALTVWDAQTTHGALEAFAKRRGLVNEKGALHVGPVAQAVRIALAGVPVTPALGETLAVLGRAESLTRIDRCLSLYGAPITTN